VTAIELDPTGSAVVSDLPHEEYLRHPALSASGAKLLVQPAGPARFYHRLAHPEPPKRAFDVGHAVHAAVLGVDPGTELVLCSPTNRKGEPDGDPYPALDFKTKSAQEHRDAIRAAGRTPVLQSDLDLAAEMATALREHPVASRLLHPTVGEPEVSLFWRDEAHDIDRRGRVDFLRQPDTKGRLILVDYKTCASAEPSAVARSVVNFGYHQQAAWYRDLVIGMGLAESAPVVFVFQETSAPYLVHVVELDDATLFMGEDRNERGMQLFHECLATDVWPGYNDRGITTVSAPRWAQFEHEAAMIGEQA